MSRDGGMRDAGTRPGRSIPPRPGTRAGTRTGRSIRPRTGVSPRTRSPRWSARWSRLWSLHSPRWSLARSTLSAVVLAVCIVALPVVLPVLAAETSTTEDGLWYVEETGVGELHDAGVTGEGVTIAMIDSPINLEVADLQGADIRPRTDQLCPDFTGVENSARARHATAMASLLVGTGTGIGTDTGLSEEPGVIGVAPDATVLHYAVLNVAVDECDASLAEFVSDAIAQGADILTLSIGYGSAADAQHAVDLALAAGLVVNVAVQNESSDQLDLLSGLPGVVSIENVDREGNPDAFSVTGPALDFLAPGVGIRMLEADFSGYILEDGTSAATAWVSGVFALAKSAWPDATGNQLLQAAIRSAHLDTAGAESEATAGASATAPPRTDRTGYGVLDPVLFLATDPNAFPDENPLLDTGTRASETSDAEPTTVPGEQPHLLWAGVAFPVATGLYAAVLLLRRRRYRASGEPRPGQ